MKRFFMLLVILMTSFYLSAKTYKVTLVEGKVTYEVKGSFIPVKEGDHLDDTSIINTGLNSKLELTCIDDNSIVVIKPMKKDTIANIIKVNGKSGITIGNVKVTKSTVTDENTKTTKGVATASSRASEAKSDVRSEERRVGKE